MTALALVLACAAAAAGAAPTARSRSAAIAALLAATERPRVERADWRAPIQVRELWGAPRRAEPVRVGVPLPRDSGVSDVAGLALLDEEGRPLPAQLRVLSRWFGPAARTNLPIKWVLVSFLADVPAHGARRYWLTPGDGPVGGEPLVRRRGERLLVDTGPLAFEIARDRFRVLESVRIDLDGDGSVDATLVDAAHPGGLFLRDLAGDDLGPAADLDTTVGVERAGPLVAIVRLRARRATAGQMPPWRYEVLWQVTRGQPWVRLQLRVGNPLRAGAATAALAFESISLVLPLVTLGDPLRLLVGPDAQDDGRTITAALPARELASVYQDSSGGANWQDPDDTRGTTFAGYTAGVGARLLRRGARFAGWVDVGTPSWGMTVALRDFWQTFPKGFRFTGDGRSAIDLWPEQYRLPHRLEPGTRASVDLFIELHRGAFGDASHLPTFALPLSARPDPAWLAATFAAGPLAPTTPDDPLATATLAVAGPGGMLTARREALDAYGWRDWPDPPLAGTPGSVRFANNAFDPLYALVRELLRERDPTPGLFALAAALARHVANIDAIHRADGEAVALRGPDPPGVIGHRAGAAPEQPWVRGLVHWYWLTGDPWLAELLPGVARWLLESPAAAASPWRTLALTELWEALGDPRLLEAAAAASRRAEARFEPGCATSPDDVRAGWALAWGRYATLRRAAGEPDAAAEAALQAALDGLAPCRVPDDVGAARLLADAMAYGALLAADPVRRDRYLAAGEVAYDAARQGSRGEELVALRFGAVWQWLAARLAGSR